MYENTCYKNKKKHLLINWPAHQTNPHRDVSSTKTTLTALLEANLLPKPFLHKLHQHLTLYKPVEKVSFQPKDFNRNLTLTIQHIIIWFPVVILQHWPRIQSNIHTWFCEPFICMFLFSGPFDNIFMIPLVNNKWVWNY